MSNDLDLVKRYFENDRFAASSGMCLVELRPGFARTSLEIEDRHLNSVGIVQGGAIFTLADLAFAMACNSAGKVAVAIDTNLSFLRQHDPGPCTPRRPKLPAAERFPPAAFESPTMRGS